MKSATRGPRTPKFELARRTLGKLSLGERLLLWLSRHPEDVEVVSDYEAPGAAWTVDNALQPFEAVFPGFRDAIRGKRVLDYGCGDGFQAIALARAGAADVVGVEVSQARLRHARALAGETRTEGVEFTEKAEGRFDVVISLDAVEHFLEPEENLREMVAALTPEGRVFVTFGPLWFAPFGHHMHFFAPWPWLNLLFSERTVYRIRSLYRKDGATTYAPDLNRMTVKKFRSLLKSSGVRVESLRYGTVKDLPIVAHIPLLRELFVNQANAVLGRNLDEVIPHAAPATAKQKDRDRRVRNQPSQSVSVPSA
ncbi:Ubiquinone biosynthesis O-methyltransferase [Planctomycetes bacterium Poly30]|uniref:Ubiquinone biosynthesis O-methyltransferase n=1 Tax=Saltatorellus ferox TaxID=2528018 RepID=A0A518EMA5_9BACT|nr:Ubiquinone biosynthesis O-methyltransferase [Planctomycetes bacterium Poly30]